MKHWVLTLLSFLAVVAVSVYVVAGWMKQGSTLVLPPRAHLLAALAVAIEIGSRAVKLTWSARAVDIHLPLATSLRTSLAGDFGAAITPARSGAEPARFLVLKEAGIPIASALVVLFAELFLEALSLAAVVLVVAIVFHDAGPVLAALVGVVGTYAGFVIGVGVVAVILARRPATDVAPAWAQRLRIRGKRWLVVERGLAKVRTAVDAVKNIDYRYATASFFASVAHVAMRLCVLPALVLGAGAVAPLAPLALWPLGFLYGAAVVPAPGGGGAVELAFRAALGDAIPARLFAAALVWWRFYTFYLYIILGAVVAGNVALRAVRDVEEVEEEFERAE